jgi:hypothetical protein
MASTPDLARNLYEETALERDRLHAALREANRTYTKVASENLLLRSELNTAKRILAECGGDDALRWLAEAHPPTIQ